MTKMFKALTIDIGASNVRVGAGRFNFSCKTGKVLVKPIIFAAPSDPEELKEKLGKAIAQVMCETPEPLQALGVCAAGIVDHKRHLLVSAANQPLWQNINFLDLARKFCPEFTETDGYEPYHVYVGNDAKAAALAQYYMGKHSKPDNLIYLTCSTGMGAGIIADGQLLAGGQCLAGEVGHMILYPDAPKEENCGCGQKGCWESRVGMKNFARNAIIWLGELLVCQEKWYLQAQENKRAIDGKLIFTAAFDKTADNWQAKRLVNDWVKNMAQGIGNLITIFNPSAMILGTVAQYWGEPLVEMIRREVRYHFVGMPTQVAHCQIKANGVHDLEVLAPLAWAFHGFQHSLEWHNIMQKAENSRRKNRHIDDLDDLDSDEL